MASRARQLIIFLKALALAQVGHLVGHMILFAARVPVRPKVLVQRFARHIAESGPAPLGRIAVALSTYIHVPRA
jgi:hypothetical protein